MQQAGVEADTAPQLHELDLAHVPLRRRVRLLTGATSFTLHALEEADLHSITVSDGPIGLRGADGESSPAAQLPSPSAMAATWDRSLVSRLAALLAYEARRKGVHVLLAPVVNLQRTPVGGRHFECFSEDPFLTGVVATWFVETLQASGVAACVKHFVGNDSETQRTSYVARIGERALREVYLAPFERAVTQGSAWTVMAAYNQVDDGIQSAPATEHGHLVNAILKKEWGFDGVVVSDWLAANSTVATALGGLDLVMPGPGGPWEERLLAAVENGDVPEHLIDDKVRRVITLGVRVGAVSSGSSASRGESFVDSSRSSSTRALLREAVARSIVVLRNQDGLLPLDPRPGARIALIGPAVVEPFIQGGGSASVTAPYATTPEHALRTALPDAVVTVHRGGDNRAHAPRIDPTLVTTRAGASGYELTLLDAAGHPVRVGTTVNAAEDWNRHPAGLAHSARIRAVVRLAAGATHRIQVGVTGAHRIWLDGKLACQSEHRVGAEVILDSSANHPDGLQRHYAVSADKDHFLHIHAELQAVDADAYGGFVRFQLRHDLLVLEPEQEIEEAVEAARLADIAIVVVGTTEETESEGWDRETLAMPGRQDELVRRVAAANPCTVVVVNAGAPVILPWLDEVPATVWWWLPGQEAGNGLFDALLGVVEPTGRLPWTLPRRAEDVPVPHGIPVKGVVNYAEGLDVGYRAWDRLEREPARPFGFGLGYTDFDYLQLSADSSRDAPVTVAVTVANKSPRGGREMIQLYVEPPLGAWPRPVRALAGFGSLDVAAGCTATITVELEARCFQVWDPTLSMWVTPPGRYRILAGRSSRDLRQSCEIALG